MSKVLGIDLGTTNSCMSVWEKGEVVVIPNAEGFRVTPSVVALSKSGEFLIGEPAKRQAVSNPKGTILSVKRLIGKKYSELNENLIKSLTYEITSGKDGNIQIVLDKKNYSPQQISAMIIKKLKNDAESYIGEKITKSVISVPAYFDENQRQATKDSGKIAGLDVIGIINEPTSAALAYGLDKEDKKLLTVYDFGGGTFDISILSVNKNKFEVLVTKGNTMLGGVDFDNELVNYLSSEFKSKYGIDLRSDPQALQRLTESSERAKCELSSIQSTEVSLPFITANENGPIHLNEVISREKFNDLIRHLIEETEEPLANCMNDSNIQFDDIEEVLLVGGTTRIPKIIENVREKFGQNKVLKTINPDEVVSFGAAIYGASLSGEVDDLMFLDVIPISLGIETSDGKTAKLIDKNTTIPTRVGEIFTTAKDNQTSVTINVVQGENDLVKDNKSIEHFKLTGIESQPKGTPHIDVIFDIDANGILHVSAIDLKNGNKKEIQITSGIKMSEEEISKLQVH